MLAYARHLTTLDRDFCGALAAAPPSFQSCVQDDYESVASRAVVAAHSPAVLGQHKSDNNCEMYYTSGTSGRPKGVMLTHKIVVLHALGCMIQHRITEKEVWGHIAPMFHLVDAYAMFSVTWLGGKHVLVPHFSAGAVLDAIEKHRVTSSNMASTMVTLLLR